MKGVKVMADKELKPCPFCGSKAEFIVYVGEENRKDTHKVACMADNSDHHGKEGVSEDWCPMEMQTDWCLTKEDAAGIWNHRQPDKELVNSLNLIFTLAGNIDQSEWPVINQRIQAIAKNLLAKYKEKE